MVKSSKLLTIFVLLLAAGFVFSSCARTKVTGGGKIVDSDGYKSTFTVNADSCDTDEGTGEPIVKGMVTYHSGTEKGTRIKGYITDAANCSEVGDLFSNKDECLLCNIIAEIFVEDEQGNDGKPNRLLIKFHYSSQNPKDRGEGAGIACMIDRGQGADADPDLAGLALFGGPFDGYVNHGWIQGNLQEHACPEED